MSDPIDDGGPAFPFQDLAENGLPIGMSERGMSLRDWFAGQAIKTAIVDATLNDSEIAEWAYNLADALIAERNKRGAP